MALGSCAHCKGRITYPAIFCARCIAEHRMCEQGYLCETPGAHRSLDLRDEAVGDVIEYTVPIRDAGWPSGPVRMPIANHHPAPTVEEIAAEMQRQMVKFATGNDCPCLHCAHLRASSGTP